MVAVIAARGLDVGVTYWLHPDLAGESNVAVRHWDAGWGYLVAINAGLCLALGGLAILASRRPPSPPPDLDLEGFLSYIYWGEVRPWYSLLTVHRIGRHWAWFSFRVLTFVIVAISVLVTIANVMAFNRVAGGFLNVVGRSTPAFLSALVAIILASGVVWAAYEYWLYRRRTHAAAQ